MTFKEWKVEFSLCGHQNKILGWDYELPFKCQGECGSNNYMPIDDRPSKTVMISTDDIPGGIMVRHGICNPDGSPKRVDSKTDLKRELNRHGWTIEGDTPKPYRIRWEGKETR